MKNLILFSFTLMFLISCGPLPDQTSDIGKQLRGDHELKQLTDTHYSSSDSSNYFTIKQSKIYFCWKTNDNSYSISSLDINKVKININDEIEVPTIKYRWRASSSINGVNIQEIFNEAVVYSVITCKDKDSKFILKNITK